MHCRSREAIRNSRRKPRRTGLAAIEVVVTTGIVVPGLVIMFLGAIRLSRVLYSVVGVMAGSPIL